MDEEIGLDLNEATSTSLFIALTQALEMYESRVNLLREITTLPEKDRPSELVSDIAIQEALNITRFIMDDIKSLMLPLSEIVKEFEDLKGKPKIFIKPKW